MNKAEVSQLVGYEFRIWSVELFTYERFSVILSPNWRGH